MRISQLADAAGVPTSTVRYYERIAEPPLAACRSDLTCCVPEPRQSPVAVELVPRR